MRDEKKPTGLRERDRDEGETRQDKTRQDKTRSAREREGNWIEGKSEGTVRVVRPAYLWDTRGIVYGFAGVWGRARARGGRREEVTRS